MTPTSKLRFVERVAPDSETTGHRVRVLQQWWGPDFHTESGEWRDVPIEKEE